MEEHNDNGTAAGGQRGGGEHEDGSKKQCGTPLEQGAVTKSSMLPRTATAVEFSFRDDELDFTWGSVAETATPSTSKSRGQLRAASLGISPSAGRSKSLGNPSPSFGAGVTKVPAPIFTKLQGSLPEGMHSQNVRDPVPAGGLPSIARTLDHGAHSSYAQDSAQRSIGQSGSQAFQAYTTLQPHLVGSNDPFDVNPYAYRADEMGPSHHLPGVGLLDDLLQPPGWKEGDEPIDPHEAKLLFNEERAKAKKMLRANIDETKHLPADDQEKRSAEIDEQWDLKFRLDQLLLTERIHVYDVYQKRKNKKLRQGNADKAMRTRVPPAAEPQPVNAMGSVPAHLQPMYTKSDSSSPDMVNAGFPRNGLCGADRGLPAGIRYLRNGSPGFLSPSLLDPSLLPGSLEAAWKIYLANQGHVVQMKANNERFLQNAFAKYRAHPSQTQISPSMFPPVTGQQARPFFSLHNGYVHHEQIGYPSPGFPRPPQYSNPLHHENIADSRQGRPFHPQGTGYPACTTGADSHEPATRDEQNLAQSSGRKPSGARPNVSRNRRVSEGQLSQIVEHEEEVTPKKKRASRAKGAKKEPWYAAQIAAANLPSAVISAEAMQAGLDWPGNKDEAVKQKSPPKPRRRAKPIIDPKKGMVISEAAAKALIANGAVDMRPKAAAVPASTTPIVAHNPVGPSGATDDQSGVLPPLNPTPGEANFIFRRNNQVTTEPTDEATSDCADDPNDADYGRRSTRRRVPTARKMATQKDTPQSKKRKSDGPSVGNKRTRLDAHVPEDEAEDVTDQNTGNAE